MSVVYQPFSLWKRIWQKVFKWCRCNELYMFLTGDFCFLDNTQRKSLKLSEATVGQFEAVEIPEEKCVEYSHE